LIDPRQFRDDVVQPTLAAMDMGGAAPENLLMGTAAVESGLRYLRQLHEGPAVGLFQMEPETARDIVQRYLLNRDEIDTRFQRAFQLINTGEIDWQDVAIADVRLKLLSDLRFATAMCRLRYWMVPEPLPAADDIEGLGRYWKQHYNTPQGAGTPEKFVAAYRNLIG